MLRRIIISDVIMYTSDPSKVKSSKGMGILLCRESLKRGVAQPLDHHAVRGLAMWPSIEACLLCINGEF